MNPNTGEIANPDDLNPNTAEATPEQEKVPPKNPRDIALAEMAKRAQKRRESEAGTFKVDVLEEDGSITEAHPDAAPSLPDTSQAAEVDTNGLESEPVKATDATPTSALPTGPTKPQEPEEERELIVDGKRIRVPVSKIIDSGIRTLQKETAADMRLAAATELLRSAQEQRQQPVAQPVAQPSDDDAALARSIQFGTEDEAKAAIARIRNAAPAITPQQIEAYVQQSLAQKLPDHQAFNEANNWLKDEYKEIVADPDLKFMFDMKEDQARKAGDRRPYKELYADLAGQLATKFNLKRAEVRQPAGQPMTTQASDRLTRKANSPRPLTGASGRMEQAPAPTRAPTVTDYVTRQRQLRGLQPLDKQGI